MIKSEDSNFEGLKIITRNVHSDSRGNFYKIFSFDDIKSFGWHENVMQVNFSQTLEKGTIRGMHMQFSNYAEYKLVTCIKGSIFDVAIDLRKESRTYLDYFSINLDENNKKSLLIPPGFAHGFQVIDSDSQIIYTHSKTYNKDFEGGIRATDPDINIKWPLKVSGLSNRDNELPLLRDLLDKKIL